MPLSSWVSNYWSGLADGQMLAAALGAASLSAFAGVRAARRMRLSAFALPAALVGAVSTLFTLTPSMLLCGTVGAGFYALLAMWLPIDTVFVGKTVVVIATVLGCALLAWVFCLTVLSGPALLAAFRRRVRRSATPLGTFEQARALGLNSPNESADIIRADREP